MKLLLLFNCILSLAMAYRWNSKGSALDWFMKILISGLAICNIITLLGLMGYVVKV